MEQVPTADIDQVFAHTTNLASCNLNSKVLACSNDYFASADNILTSTPTISRPGVFVHTSAWYDGWESRRHNPEPYEWAVIKLGVAAAPIHGVEVDTAFFKENCGEKAELQTPISRIPASPCGPSQRHGWKYYADVSQKAYTYVRLLMYPDGGFARLRLYGHAIPLSAPAIQDDSAPLEELSSALNGGLALAASDEHFTPSSNILLPGRGKDMGAGWETARSRCAGHVNWAAINWVLLGLPGSVSKVAIDTRDFRGNFPRAVRVHGLVAGAGDVPSAGDSNWVGITKGDKRCQADTEHVIEADDLTVGGADTRVFTHVKRLRIFGRCK